MSTTPVFDDLFHADPGMMGGGAVSPAELEQLRSELHEQVGRQDWWRVADIACRLANVHVDPHRVTGTPRVEPLPLSQPKHRMPRALRAEVFDLHGQCCVYCGDPATTVDHVIPQAKGGTDDLENLRPACLPCNTSKGAKDLDQWDGPPHRREAVQ